MAAETDGRLHGRARWTYQALNGVGLLRENIKEQYWYVVLYPSCCGRGPCFGKHRWGSIRRSPGLRRSLQPCNCLILQSYQDIPTTRQAGRILRSDSRQSAAGGTRRAPVIRADLTLLADLASDPHATAAARPATGMRAKQNVSQPSRPTRLSVSVRPTVLGANERQG